MPLERRGDEPHRLGLAQRGEDVRALAGGGDRDGDVAGPSERLDLARENLLEAEIVAGGGERGGVGGQRDRGDGGAVGLVADGQFGREMLGVGGAAAIAEEHQLAAAADRVDAGPDQAGEGGRQRRFGARATS